MKKPAYPTRYGIHTAAFKSYTREYDRLTTPQLVAKSAEMQRYIDDFQAPAGRIDPLVQYNLKIRVAKILFAGEVMASRLALTAGAAQ